jgi:Isochorismatase family
MQPKRLQLARAALFCCDIQEKLRNNIFMFPHVVYTANSLIKLGKVLDLPLIVTEQYSKGLGKTVAEIDVSSGRVFQKGQFSMMTPEVSAELERLGKSQVILFGLETHVCILQTTLDLLESGRDVFLVSDGISSSAPIERSAAFARMQQAGAVVTSMGSVLMELIKTKDHPQFKLISQLLKESKINSPPEQLSSL